MPWSGASGSQTYTRSDGVRSGIDVYAQQKAAGIDIVAAQHDATEQDLATAVNLTLKKDGGNKPTANIDWGAFRLTNLGAPTADNDAIRRTYAEEHLVLTKSEFTIASGAVTPTRSCHSIDTESDAATDNLDQIVTTNMRSGQLLYLYQDNSGRKVTVRNAQGAAGQIHTRGNRDIDLSTENPLVLQLVYGTDWYEVSHPWIGNPDHAVIQRVVVSATSIVGGGTAIPWDDTKPQNTEGNSWGVDLTITPKHKDSKIKISWDIPLISNDTAQAINVLALFKDSDVDAIAAWTLPMRGQNTGATVNDASGFTIIDSTNTTARTYKLRYGCNTGNIWLCANQGNSIHSTLDARWFMAEEIFHD